MRRCSRPAAPFFYTAQKNERRNGQAEKNPVPYRMDIFFMRATHKFIEYWYNIDILNRVTYFCYFIRAPKGVSANCASLKCCTPKGMPMMVKQNKRPHAALAIAISNPPKRSHRIFKRRETVFVPGITSFPKGKKATADSLKHCKPTGIPMIVQHHSKPIKSQPNPIKNPPKRNHIIFPNTFMPYLHAVRVHRNRLNGFTPIRFAPHTMLHIRPFLPKDCGVFPVRKFLHHQLRR